jgi:hypothetical protein
MQVGTEIILQRMKDCPEEFVFEEGMILGKWEKALRGARDILPLEDVEALDAGYRQLRIDQFNERVLKTLSGENDVDREKPTATMKTSNRYAIGASDPRGMFGQAQMKSEGQPVNYNAAQNSLADPYGQSLLAQNQGLLGGLF